MSASTEGALAGGELLGDGLGFIVDLARLESVDCGVENTVSEAFTSVSAVGLGTIEANGLGETGPCLGLEGGGEVVAEVDEGHVGLGEVGRVAGLVDVDLAVEQSLGQVGQLLGSGAGVGSSTRQVALVTTSNINQLEGDGGEHSLLARLASSGIILLGHPAVGLVIVSNDVSPDPHVGQRLLIAGVIKRGAA